MYHKYVDNSFTGENIVNIFIKEICWKPLKNGLFAIFTHKIGLVYVLSKCIRNNFCIERIANNFTIEIHKIQ